jgi:Zn-dependent M28 family amino/carboxypeptidase
VKHLPLRATSGVSTLVLLALAACSPKVPVSSEPAFDAARISEDVRVLSADEFEGRAPATAGEGKTVEYLAAQLKAAGLEPGGDPLPDGGRAWTQSVPLVRSQITGPVQVQVRSGKQVQDWTQGEQVVLRATLSGQTQVDLKDAPLVFVGYGVNAPERNWDDFKGVDLKGKVALVLVNDPDFETGEGLFGGEAMTWYGRWTYKFEEMARRGAAGVLVIHETQAAAYGWSTVKSSNSAAEFDVHRENPLLQHVPVEGWIQRDAAAGLLKQAGLDFEALKVQARTQAFEPVTLKGVTFSTRFAVSKEEVISRNVIGVLPGTKQPGEWVIYSAHWDAFGVGAPDASGDTIYNGALDNAAGVAQVLEIARAYSAAARPRRSVAFMLLTAEESGLLGSEYYATHPLYPLAKTAALLNTDSPRPYEPSQDFSTGGDAPTTLQDALIDTGKALGRRYTPESRPEAGMYFRSDHFPFARQGVPGISFKTGEELPGGPLAGKDWYDQYTRERYHQPSDEYDPKVWRSEGIAADARLLYQLGRRIADSEEWPEWKQGAEFKAIRDATAAERKRD